MGTISCDFGVSDKASSPLNCSDGVGLGLKMQSSESLSKKPTMMHHRPSSSPPKQAVAGDDCGPTMGCRSIYHDVSAPATSSVTCCSGGGAVFTRTLQPFDNSISNSNSNFTTAFKSPGMAATLGFPFTAAQWKELERQAMIYKYMVASVPVPYDLLLPTSANPASHPPGGSIFSQLRYSTKQDPEPGRCKRTDGKKWRCSRDVAPHQKYCERHMHRGRPRSRKHVEIQSQNQDHSQNQTNKKGRLHNPNPPRLHQSNQSFPPKVVGSTILPNEPSLLLDPKNIQHISYKEPNRGLDWMMEGEMVTMDTSEQQWHHLMHQPTNLGSIYNTNHSVFHQDYEEEPLSLFSYTDFGGSQDFMSTDFVSLERENPRGFIDAWSNNNPNPDDESNNKKDTSVSSNGNLSPSSLTLSMAMAVGNGNTSSIDEETGRIQAGQGSSLLSHISWVGSTAGGPLAEVLRHSSIAIDSDPASPNAGNGDQISPPATTVSSPSGVLQRTMLSLSDNSVCNSPTLASSTARPEIVAFQWLN